MRKILPSVDRQTRQDLPACGDFTGLPQENIPNVFCYCYPIALLGPIGAEGKDLKVSRRISALQRTSTSEPRILDRCLDPAPALNSLWPLQRARAPAFGTPHCRTGSAPSRGRCDESSGSHRRTPGTLSRESSLSGLRSCFQLYSTLLASATCRDTAHPYSLATNNGFSTHLFGYVEFQPGKA